MRAAADTAARYAAAAFRCRYFAMMRLRKAMLICHADAITFRYATLLLRRHG